MNIKTQTTEGVLLGLTALFLCGLLLFHVHGQKKADAVETDRDVPQEAFLPDTTPLDLNTATAEELERLPGIGPELAERILAHRTQHGAFETIEELMEVPGIGEGKLAALEGYVQINGGTAHEDSGGG